MVVKYVFDEKKIENERNLWGSGSAIRAMSLSLNQNNASSSSTALSAVRRAPAAPQFIMAHGRPGRRQAAHTLS